MEMSRGNKLILMCWCLLSLQHYYQNKLKLAIIGQSLFGQEVYSNLRKQGHKVVGVFTVPDKDGKADPLGEFTPLSLTCFWPSLCIALRHKAPICFDGRYTNPSLSQRLWCLSLTHVWVDTQQNHKQICWHACLLCAVAEVGARWLCRAPGQRQAFILR